MNVREAYRKERKRIQNYISARKKKGFLSDFRLPEIPKKVTQGSINKLKKITPEVLRQHEGIFVDYETGEFIRTDEHWKLSSAYKKKRKEKQQKKKVVRKQKNKKQSEIKKSDLIKSNVEATLSQLPDNVERILRKAFENILFKGYTWDDIARKMEVMASQGKMFDVQTLYSQGKALEYSSELFTDFDVGFMLEDLEEVLMEEDYNDYDSVRF